MIKSIQHISAVAVFCLLSAICANATPFDITDTIINAGSKQIMPIEKSYPALPVTPVETSNSILLDSISTSDSSHVCLDSISVSADSVVVDSAGIRKNLIDEPVLKMADDSFVYDIANRKVFMYKNAKVTYQDKVIEADYIEFDSEKKVVYACGVADTSGKIVGQPKFKDGEDDYEMEKLYYNFDTKKALIFGVITQQGEAFLHGQRVKKMSDNTTFSKDAIYTTCDCKEHPHFYVKMSRAKMIPAKKEKRDKDGKLIQRAKDGQIVFGFSHLVVEDVPLPIFVPWGFFPIHTGTKNGIIFPKYGEENERGFYLQDFGYYFRLGDYADVTMMGEWYSKGSWAYKINSNYVKRYKFRGGLGFQYSTIKLGDKGSPDYDVSKSYSINWSHSKAPQTSPSTTFQASVNFSTTAHKRYNDQSLNDALQATANSSVSFSKQWEGTPFSMTTAFNHSQNMRDSTYSFGFPAISLSMSKIYPFRKANRAGKKKFYEDIGFSYNMKFDNSVSNIHEDYLFKEQFWDAMRNGMSHSFSIGLPTFTLAKYVTVSPSISYGTNWYFQSATKRWDATAQEVVTDTTSTFGDFGMSHTYSGGISMSTRIYGLFDKFSEKSKIRAIRHVITPSLSISYTPNQRISANGWRTVKNELTGEVENYNIYNINRSNANSASGSRASGSVNLSIGNTLEMKVRSASDTSENGEKKIKILESFNVSASYDLLADSMNLSTIRFNGRTNLFDRIGITFGFVLDPYEIDYRGQRSKKYYIGRHGFSLGRLTSFNWSTDYTFSSDKSKGKGSDNRHNQNNDPNDPNNLNNHNHEHNNGDNCESCMDNFNMFGPNYVNFEVPWSLSLGWSYNFNKSYNYNSTSKELKTNNRHAATLTIRGDMNLTKNWKITASSGYDVSAKKITVSQFSIVRDLHCFMFEFSWVPFGFRKSWGFTIRAKSSMIKDALKYDKHSSFFDN